MGCDNNRPAKDSFHSDVLPPLTPSDRGLLSRWARATNRLADGNSHMQADANCRCSHRKHKAWHVREAETSKDLFLMQVWGGRKVMTVLSSDSLHYLPREEQQSKDRASTRTGTDKRTHTQEDVKRRVIGLDSFLITSHWKLNTSQ